MAVEAADLIVRVRAEGVAQTQAALAGLGKSTDAAGDDANEATVAWNFLKDSLGDAGRQALMSAVALGAVGRGADQATSEVKELNRALLEAGLLRGSGFGGGGGKGFATDVGSAFRGAANIVQGFIGALTLVMPTINIIIAGLVGVVSLLGAATIAAVGFAAALTATVVTMAAVSFKWRTLLSDTEGGAARIRGAFLAVQAEAFNLSKALFESFSGGTGDVWAKLAESAIKGLRAMQPVIRSIIGSVMNFVDALNGVPGATSPFLDWLRTWLMEWKVLRNILNEGLPDGKGFFGFLEKYEKPAKAFVEGIAKVLNGLRKMSAAGLGLNMEELSKLISNLFDWLARMVQIFPTFTNSLVQVGLAFSEWLRVMTPVIDEAFQVGTTILKYIVAPLAELVLLFTRYVLTLPVFSWLAALAGGFTLVAFALAKLSFGAVKFTTIIGVMAKQMFLLSFSFGNVIVGMVGLQAIQGTVLASLVGLLAVAGLLYVAFKVFQIALKGVNEAYADMEKAAKSAFDAMSAGGEGVKPLSAAYESLAADIQDMSFIEQMGFTFKNFGQIAFEGLSQAGVAAADAQEAVAKLYDETAKGAVQAAATGTAWTEDLIGQLRTLQTVASQGLTMPEPEMGSTFFDRNVVQNKDEFEGLKAAFLDQEAAAADLEEVLAGVNSLYAEGSINAGQYATYIDILNDTLVEQTKDIDLYALKVEGVANTIAEALNQVGEDARVATGGLENFARSSGQSFDTLKSDIIGLVDDVAAGFLGSGTAVTDWFKAQAQAIRDWKAQTADSFNFVKSAFAGLAGEASVTFNQIRDTLRQAVQDLRNYGDNWERLRDLDASKEVLRQIKDMGQGGGVVMAGLIQGGRAGVQEVNRLVRQGVDLSTALADNMADALGITMEKLVAAVVYMVHQLTGVALPDVMREVNRMVDDTNKKTGELKDRTIRIGFGVAGANRARVDALPKVPKLQVPKPDLPAIRATYVPAGKAAQEGFAQGTTANQALATNALRDSGAKDIEALRKAIGASSPAQKFAEIGVDMMMGVVQGVRDAQSFIVLAMFNAGLAAMNGMRAGMQVGMIALRGWLAGELASIAADIRNAMGGKGTGSDRGHRDRVPPPDRPNGVTTPTTVSGKLSFDWKAGAADLDGAVAWEERNTA